MSKGEIIPESAVRFVRDFDAPPAKLWAFLTDSKLLPEWYGDGRVEPREGGKVSLMAGHIRGVVTGWRPEKFLGYTWSVFQPGEEVSAWPTSYLEMALEETAGGTRLTLTHRPIPEPMYRLTMIGWHTMLDMIADGLGGRFPPRLEVMNRNAALYGVDLNALKGDPMDEFAERLDDHTVRFVRILPGPIERVWDYLWDGRKRGEWFASGAMPTKVGERFEMRFKHSELSPHQATPPDKMAEIDRTGHTSTNILLAYDPPRRLVFTFGPEARGYSEVEFRLDPQEDNKVRFTLTHSRIPDHQYMVDVSGGWHTHLAILEARANGRVPPAFWDVWRQYDGVYNKRHA